MISPTALTGTPTEDEATRAARSAQEKLKAEKARKKRLARERAKAHEELGSRQQDQMYYGYAALDALQRRDRHPAAFTPMVRRTERRSLKVSTSGAPSRIWRTLGMQFQSDRGLAHNRCRSSGLDASIAIISVQRHP
jgi:hypothetical protein